MATRIMETRVDLGQELDISGLTRLLAGLRVEKGDLIAVCSCFPAYDTHVIGDFDRIIEAKGTTENFGPYINFKNALYFVLNHEHPPEKKVKWGHTEIVVPNPKLAHNMCVFPEDDISVGASPRNTGLVRRELLLGPREIMNALKDVEYIRDAVGNYANLPQ